MRSSVVCAVIILSLCTTLRAQPVFDPFHIHDPSTIQQCDGKFWVFGTGPGVISRYSTNLLDWRQGPPVFRSYPDWVTSRLPGRRGQLWAPDLLFHNGRYFLYYSVSVFGKNTSAIGLATNPTLEPSDPKYVWTDHGPVIESTAADKFNTIDPCVFKAPSGELWLVFGSFWSGIKLLQLNPDTGKRLFPHSPLFSVARHDAIEAPFLHHHGEHYYLFVNWGICCRGVNSTYEIRVGRSSKITGPYLDASGRDLLNSGGSLLLATEGNAIGPGHAGILSLGHTNWLSYHFYDRNNNGRPTLGLKQLTWKDGWPMVLRN